MSDKRWRVRIYNQNSTSLSTGNVYWQTTALASPVTVRGPIIRPTLGRAESQPWAVDILDDGSSVTAHLADSSGRLFLLGRVISVERSLGGGAFAAHGAGRISDVLLNDNIATYQIVAEDERRIERNATIFNTTNTTRLYPSGPGVKYGIWPAVPTGTLSAVQRSGSKAVLIVFDRNTISNVTDAALQAMRDDLVVAPITSPTSVGNFAHLRCRIGSRDHGIISFGSVAAAGGSPSQAWLADLDTYRQSGVGIKCWVWATTSQVSVGSRYSTAFLHMYSAPPSAATPLHIGSSAGLTPPQMLLNVYGGSYSSAGSPKIRYSTAAFDTLKKQGWPLIRFRITEAANMADWLEQNIFQPFMIAPLVDAQGRVTPVSLKLPNSTAGITFTFTGANLRAPYPSWQHVGREQITRMRIVAEAEWAVTAGFGQGFVGPAPTSGGVFPGFRSPPGGDGMQVAPSTYVLDHDRISQFGIKELRVTARGLHPTNAVQQQDNQTLPPRYDGGGLSTVFTLYPAIPQYLAWIRRDYFDRYGDGPVLGRLAALSTAESLAAGAFTKLALNTFPNASVQARGGTRIVQLLSRDDTPEGPEFSYLDAGNSLAGLAAPTLTISTSTADPKHSLRATVGSVPAAGGYRLEIIGSNAAPASSAAWQPVATVTSTAGAQRLGQLPAGRKFWVRAQNQQAARLRSAWTLSTGKTTASLAAPSALASTSVKAGTVGLTWTPGETDEMTDVHADTSTSAAISTANFLARLTQPGASRYTVGGLTARTKYLLAVRHADPYGGYSTANKLTVTTASSAVGLQRCPAPLGVTILIGR
jgi:hypothetical protein